MQVTILGMHQPRKPSCLAEASIRIELDGGEFVAIHDLRLIRNKAGVVWCALPTFSVKEGSGYKYEPTVETSRELRRMIEDAVLPAYEAWTSQKAEVRP